jgi:ferric-dicitrate binding protein FerR (iron transport regulator)
MIIRGGFGMNFFARKYWAALMPLLFGAILATAAPQAGRIALLQYVNGAVSIQPGGTGSWVAAAANRPLSISDNVWTDKASRAELNVGTGLMQLNSETSLTLVNVDRGTVQVQLHQGTLFLHVRHLFDGEIYEVDSSNGTFTLTKSGNYRFDVDSKANTTTITVWKGEGRVSGDRPVVRVKAHEQVLLAGTAVERHKNPKPDGFDEWARVRNQRQDSAYPRVYPYPYPYPYPPGVVVYGRPGPWYWR